jgi:hypothetical protein
MLDGSGKKINRLLVARKNDIFWAQYVSAINSNTTSVPIPLMITITHPFSFSLLSE